MSLNEVKIIGNLGQDPEVKFTPSGKAVTTLSVATNRTYPTGDVGADGKKVYTKEVEWHRVVVWGAAAEACGKYLKKGRQVYVCGRLHTRSWEDKDGVKRYTTEIIANMGIDNVQFLGSGNGGADRPDKQPGYVSPENAEEYIGTPPDGDDGDIPF